MATVDREQSQAFRNSKDVERTLLILKTLVAVLAVISLALLISVIVLATKDNTKVSDVGFCPEETQLKSSQPRSSGLYDDLSKDEILAVRDYILGQSSLNVTPYETATINSNYIHLIELQQPRKDQVIDYLDNGKKKPERSARVIIYCGGETLPVVKEYLVSPAEKPNKHRKHIGPGHNDTIPFKARPPDSIESAVMNGILVNLTRGAYRILYESYDGYTYSGCTDRCLTWSWSVTGAIEEVERKNWVWFGRDLPGVYLQRVGFEVYINTGGSDVSMWTVEKVFYHNASFDSVEQLMRAYDSGSMYKVFLPAPSFSSEKPLFSSLQRRGGSQPPKPLRRPELFEPDGNATLSAVIT